MSGSPNTSVHCTMPAQVGYYFVLWCGHCLLLFEPFVLRYLVFTPSLTLRNYRKSIHDVSARQLFGPLFIWLPSNRN